MKRIGIIRGGIGENYEESLAKGSELFSFVEKNIGDRWKPVDIFIDKVGIWHMGGLPVVPADLCHKVDIFWNNASPEINGVLDNLGFPHISTPAFSAGLGKSRAILEAHMRQAGIPMPKHFILPAYQEDFDARPNDGSVGRGSIERYANRKAREIFEKFGSPWIVKSLTEDVSMGIHVANTFQDLVNAIIDGAEHGRSIVVEELIAGKEVSMHSLKNFRDEDVYIFPGSAQGEEREVLHGLIRDLHQNTGAEYLKSLFILNPTRGIYLKTLEFEPDFSESSDLHDATENIGAKAHHILESILENKI